MSQPALITDSHCHLDFPQFEGELGDLLERAAQRGVHRVVTICTKLRAEPTVRTLAEAYAPIFYAAGTHPMSVADEPMATVQQLVDIAQHPKCVGIGETGLDYHYTADSMAAQQESLRLHIEAARQTQLPLIIHARDADDDIARILTEEHHAAPYTCVMHCFSSGPALADAALGLGFYLSMSGIATFPKSDELRSIFAAAPVNRILVETDSPYLAPPPNRGKRNEPAFVVDTAAVGAEIFGMDYNAFARQAEANFETLFSKVTTWQS